MYSRLVKRSHGLVLGLVLAGCSGPAPSTDSSRPGDGAAEVTDSTPQTLGSQAAASPAAILAFATEPDTLEANFAELHRLARERPDELRAAALDELDAGDPETRYGALYAVALTAEGTEAIDTLIAALSSPNVNERMLASGSLIARGEKAAFPVLIEMLGSDEQLAFRDPPQMAWQFARFVLIQYTDEDMGLLGPAPFAADRAVAAQPAWRDWWISSGASLEFDALDQVFR